MFLAGEAAAGEAAAGEAAVVEAAVKNTGYPAYKERMLIRPVSGLGAGLTDRAVRGIPVMRAP